MVCLCNKTPLLHSMERVKSRCDVCLLQEKPHKCGLCSKSFPTPGDLKSHMYVHNGSWPFKCHICNRGFSKHTNLKNHLFLHTGRGRFHHILNMLAYLDEHGASACLGGVSYSYGCEKSPDESRNSLFTE